MNNNTSNNFCKNYVYKYVDCLDLNNRVFGKKYAPEMCINIRDILEHCKCEEFIKKEFNMNLNEIDYNILNIPNPSRS